MNDRGTRADRQPAVWNENTGVVLARRTPTGASSHARWDRAAINSVWDSNARSFGCWLSRLRACRRYEVITGVLGSAWFMVLALVVAVRALQLAESIIAADFSAAGWPALVVSVCMLTFFLMLWWFTLPRSSPTARTDKLLPSLVAFVGSYLPWAIALVTPERSPRAKILRRRRYF